MNSMKLNTIIDRSLIQTEKEMLARWGDYDKPLVSINCTTYNHERYIADALDGFLIQKTDFPIEILVHDDASTDRTPEIIRSYEERYSNIIKPIYQKVNQYSQGKKPSVFNFERAQGEYIAMCEGDDYWTDEKKLQTQVSFLEANPDYVISGHDAFIVDEDGNHIKDSKLPNSYKRDYSGEELIMDKAWILTMSWVYRNLIKDYAPERNMVTNGDKFLISIIGHYGKSKYHSEIKSAGYHVHSGGVWSMLSDQDKRDSKINTWFWMYRYYTRIGEEKYAKHFWFKYLVSVVTHAPIGVLLKELLIKGLQLRRLISFIRWVLAKIGLKKSDFGRNSETSINK